jgi:hypothetical protein
MLREFMNVRQIPGEDTRRWFSDNYFDLIVWFDSQEAIVGFQLCYDINSNHRALTWHTATGFSHHRVDNGESRSGKTKASPILVADGLFDAPAVAARFQRESRDIDPRIAAFVYEKLRQYH